MPGSVQGGMAAIRTLALVGPASSGKTSLAEALLVEAGEIGQAGSLERGTTVSDHHPLERQYQHSLASSVMHLTHQGVRVHLLDTPGMPDFLGQSLPALEAVDTAAIVVSATTGLEPQALRMMAIAAERRLDRIVIVNKIDAAGVDLPGLLAQIQEAFGKACLPLNLPAGGASRVVDCFYNRTGTADFGSVEDAHRALVEQVVEVDAGFVERYLADGDVDASELHAPLEQALREGHLIPVCFTSARSGAGLAELLDIIERLLPHPGEGNPPQFLRGEGDEAVPIEAQPDPSAHVIAHVFKVTSDPYVGKLGIFRVHQGTLTRDSQLYIGDGRRPFKVGHLFLLQGKAHVEVDRVGPGEIAAVAKVEGIHADAVLHDSAADDHIHLKPLAFPVPVHGLAIRARRPGDEQRLSEALARLVDEDPCLRLEQVAATRETVIVGLGELHLRVLMDRLRDMLRIELDARPPRIAYRETVSAPAAGHHRHKKQTGGAGQFGEVFLRVRPLPRGAGFSFVDEVKGGAIPTSFMPAVEKGIRDVLEHGAVAGYPVVDIEVTVHDGKSHSVDSKEIAFVTAARKAFIGAIREARPMLLEPVAELEILAPEAAMGDITGDLLARRGAVHGSVHGASGTVLIQAHVPLAELGDYPIRLGALTQGQGRYTVRLSHHDTAPPAVQRQLIQAFQPHDDD